MDESRRQAYLNLIQQLLNCPSGEESKILNANQALIDWGLMEAMLQAVEVLEEKGDLKAAKFLINIALLLADELKSSQLSKIESQIVFFKQILVVAIKTLVSDDNLQEIESLLRSNINKMDDNFPLVLSSSLKDIVSKMQPEQTQSIASAITCLSTIIQQFPSGVGKKATNLEIAIAGHEFASSLISRNEYPEIWAGIQNDLGNAYCERINCDLVENVEKAIECYIQALDEYKYDAFPKKWAIVQNGLGTAYHKRAYYQRTKDNKIKNLNQAIECQRQALSVYTPDTFPQQWADLQNNLAVNYIDLLLEGKIENVETTIKYLKQVLENESILILFPEQWAKTQYNLGYAYNKKCKTADNLNEAIRCYQLALEFYSPDTFPEDWARTKNNIAGVYMDLSRIQGSYNANNTLSLAISFYTEALQIYKRDAFPENYAETKFNLGVAYQKYRQLQLAYYAFADAIVAAESLRGSIVSGDESKQKLAEKFNKCYCRMVEVCLELKNYTEAIQHAERSKARNLVELLANRESKPKGEIPETVLDELSRLRQEIYTKQRRLEIEERNRDILGMISETGFLGNRNHIYQLQQQLDELITRYIKPIDPNFNLTQKVEPIPYSEIQSLTGENTAILEWYITGDKFLTFIITPQSPTPIIWQSSTADLKKLIRWAKGYLQAYGKKKKDQWKRRLTVRLRLLAKILHIDEILEKIPKQCDRLILIPHRFLHLFPLHALPVSQETWLQFNPNSDSSPANPYLLDCFADGVGYAPSCQLLQQAQMRQRPNFSHLFAIQNPTNDLQYTDLEVQAIAQHFHPSDILANAAAKIEALDEQRLRNAHCAHFSCHGYFNFANPLQSALLLADCHISPAPPEPDPNRYLLTQDGSAIDLSKCLTLDNIFTRDFSACRLVVLSACETGLTDFSSLSDEYIGLPSGFLVAGSPSVVSSLWAVNDLSTALLMIKFYQNLQQGLSVGLALNYAQIWLRDITGKELQEWTSRLQLDENSKKTIQQFIRWIYPNEKRFQTPVFWAAFCAIRQ